MVINGTNLSVYNQVSILDPTTGTSKPFQVVSTTAAQIISESIDALSLPMDKALDLILSSASAQQTFPITFTLQPNSVDTDNLVDGSIIGDKIRFRSITLSKLLPDIGSHPQVGDYVRWNGIDFILDPAPPSGGGGGASGTVTSINIGPGLLSSSNPITTIGTISVNIGTTGAAAPTAKIPYFNDKNKIVLDSTTSAPPDFSGLRLQNGSNYFDIFNENALKIEGNNGAELLILDYSGDLDIAGSITSAGSPVCTAAAPCSAPPGSVVTSVTVSPPLISSGTTNINIGAKTGTAQGDLVLLGAPGTYPGVGKLPAVDGSGLLGVITDVLPGTAISVSKLLGNATVGVLFGTGAAQQWQRNLDNLGTLNPNDNYVIIGNGTSFEVQGGNTLLTSIGAMIGPPSSTANAIAKFTDSTGKNLSSSGVLINGSNDLSGIAGFSSSGNMTVDTSTFLVDATNNNVGIGGSPVTVNGFGATLLNVQASVSANTFPSSVPVGLNLRNSNNNLGYTPALIFSSQGNSNGITSAIASNVTYNAGIKDANLEFYTQADPQGLLKVMEFIGDTGNANITYGLTINNNGTNSSTFPTTRGTAGQALTTNGSGTLSWTNVGGTNDVSNATPTTDNAIARFDGTTGKIIQNSGVIIDDTNNMSGIQNLTAKGNNTNNPAPLTSAIDFMVGRTSSGTLNPGQSSADLAFEYGGANGGYRHYILTTHNGTASSNLNSFRFYLNNSTVSTGSSAPGTGNTMALAVTEQGVGIFTTSPANALDVTGSIEATGQISSGASTITTNAVDWNNGNIISTNYNCAANITFANLKIGGTYTLIDTDTGTTQCNFSTTPSGTDAATVTYRFRPANTTRIASTHSIYTLMRVGNTVYVSWGSGF
jgi:hypothetical protein